ncbi:hypothetical protein [Labilibaculum euxinus]|uniref:Uncharacterized protein n=1 Tax=Labilibaculum euxinus TaxID=2686357 RepID=A0A7M4D1X0_9BACT|nr:hypothetical protein [Labilibaculum euxinus]MUP36649.1 hypothetical protein [Labilibaculum euxinus]MVB05854.1 hypothetical protein [Labilibaculum euxinus]
MKQLILGLLSIIATNSCETEIKPLPEFWYEELLPKIIPNDNINYWEYRNYDYIDSITEIKFKKGVKSITIPKIELNSSFREGCHPTICFDYIVAIRNGNLYIIDETCEVLDFIGKIDNLEEGLLVKYIIAPEYYSINDEGEEIGLYYLNKKEIIFFLLKDEREYPKKIGQYKLSINRRTHEVVVTRIKTYYEDDL